MCLHEVISSFRLFREANSGLENSKVLPQRHRLHRFEALLSRGGWRGGVVIPWGLEGGVYGLLACLKIQVTLKFMSLSLKCQICLFS